MSLEPSTLFAKTPLVVRVASHVVVWVTVLVSLGVELGHSWRPVGDNAAITSRAFQTFSLHPPVLGMLSTASGNGHTVYDPGPLLFWLLAIPVRIDAMHGSLWGAALLAGITLSLAVEAVWSTHLWPACGVIAFVVADMFWLTPSVFENIVWNAYFPHPVLHRHPCSRLGGKHGILRVVAGSRVHGVCRSSVTPAFPDTLHDSRSRCTHRRLVPRRPAFALPLALDRDRRCHRVLDRSRPPTAVRKKRQHHRFIRKPNRPKQIGRPFRPVRSRPCRRLASCLAHTSADEHFHPRSL